MFPQASSQLYPDSAPQLYPETTADAPSQFYTDPKSQLYPEPTQFFPEPTQFFPEPTQFFPEPTQFYPDTTSQLFTDTTSQMYSDLTSQLSSNPFTAPDQFVPSVDNFQYPAFSGTSTVDELTVPSAFTAFGPVDNLPTTRLDGGDISSQFVPEVCVDIAIPSEVVNNGSFTVVPVEDVQDYSLVDNALQKDTRADSLDSLSSGKGYASDASSDIYMNSDYTDTLNSVTSHTLLLEASKYSKESNSAPNTEETITAEPETAPLSDSFYTNDAFDSGVSLTSQYRSEHSLSSEVIPEEKNENEEDNENYNWITAYNSGNHEGEDSGATQDGGNVSDTEQVLLEAPDCVEDLVHQLAEQHPSDVVELHVEVLDEPVYQPLTEPIPEEEEGWMNSTESLHHYKLLKQGRTGTMFNLHERQSFLNLTAASVTSLGHVCQKALQYVRADMEFGSMMSLGLGDSMKHPSLLTLGKGGQPPSDLESLSGGLKKKIEPSVASGRHTRNLIYVSVLATILLVSINATRNLQSSLNQEGGVGITSLAISFAFYTLGSLISPIVVQKLGVRGSITFGLVLQLIYVAANLYPVMWLMAPASAGGGVSLAIIWNAVSTYIVLLARGESSYKEKLYERVSDKYFGIFCLIYQCNLVVGNLIASLILTFGDSAGSGSAAMLLNNTGLLNSSASNLTGSLASTQLLLAQNYFINNNETADRDVTGETLGLGSQSDFGLGTNVSSGAFDATKETHYHLCGSAFCHHFEINQDASTVSDYTKYLLFGIFMFLIGLAILIATFLLEPLCVRLSTVAAKPWQTVKRQVVSLARFSCNTKFLLLLPLLFYSNMQFSFVCSEVMMVSQY
nr:hypothetical protein BaRGS_027677 [Batillaria attramentaria]